MFDIDKDKNLIRAKIEDLKPGDTVYIGHPFKLGTVHFRYPRLVDEIVVRVTPKKTKLVTDKNDYVIANTKVYLENDECHRMRQIVGMIAASFNCLVDMNYYRHNICKLSDDQIKEFATHILAASAILDTVKKDKG